MFLEDSRVVGEQAEQQPDEQHLQWVAGIARRLEPVVQPAHTLRGFDVDRVLLADLLGPVACDEAKAPDVLVQVAQPDGPVVARFEIEKAKPAKIRNQDVTREVAFRDAFEVVSGLGESFVEILTRALVFDEEHALPERVDAAVLQPLAGAREPDLLLENGNAFAFNAEHLEKVVPEALRFRPLGLGVFPFSGEREGAITNLVPGKHYRNELQQRDFLQVLSGVRAAADLDFVCAWFVKAAEFIQGTSMRVAFVATNSITQGEQVSILWSVLEGRFHVSIFFAHQTFRWTNEGRGQAGVHCVIIGYAAEDLSRKRLFVYEHPNDEPNEISVSTIGPYLTEVPRPVVSKQQRPICRVPEMRCGSKPSDGGHLILSEEERAELVRTEPKVKRYLRRYVGSEELLNGGVRWCLWLDGVSPAELRDMPDVMKRVEAVRAFRMKSTAAPTRNAARTPTRFFFLGQPSTDYIAIPEVSSERRLFVPIALMSKDVISSNKNYLIPDCSHYLLGVLQSTMHMAWLRAFAGRLESRFQYSGTMVYNTFPWPVAPSRQQIEAIERGAEGVLDARTKFPDSTLADLYDPIATPRELTVAHQILDRAVDAAYLAGTSRKVFASDAERVAFLFELYQRYTSLLPATAKAQTARKPRKRGP